MEKIRQLFLTTIATTRIMMNIPTWTCATNWYRQIRGTRKTDHGTFVVRRSAPPNRCLAAAVVRALALAHSLCLERLATRAAVTAGTA
jgi:hypothetical protein